MKHVSVGTLERERERERERELYFKKNNYKSEQIKFIFSYI